MATFKPPKSILKKPTYPATSSSKAERDRDVAFYHANIIQQRKEVELQILLNTETLIDYPLAKFPYSASNPSPEDTNTFKELLRHFQPSDYDAMILERNINEHCGFALCPNARVKDGSGGRFRLVGMNGKAKDFRILESWELEKWCSEACAKRAMYVRVQLSERPAWERGDETAAYIDLLDEPKSADDMVFEGLNNLSLAADEADRKGNANLALERGDTKGFAAKNGLVGVKIQENTVQRPAEPPSLGGDLSERLETMHLSVEGYTSTFTAQKTRSQDSDMDLWGED